jgi:hypothetical protein
MLIMSQRLALEFEEILITFKGDWSSGALNRSRFCYVFDLLVERACAGCATSGVGVFI